MPSETARPSPVPSPSGLVVKNGSKTRGTTSAGIPGPLSSTVNRQPSPARVPSTITLPSSPAA